MFVQFWLRQDDRALAAQNPPSCDKPKRATLSNFNACPMLSVVFRAFLTGANVPEASSRLSNAFVGIAVLCALATTGMAVRREFFLPQVGSDTRPVKVKSAEWDEMRRSGWRLGPANAKVEIVVYSDFQCPSCRNFATRTWSGLQAKYPHDVALIFHHWPLEYHKSAYPAAIAAECAGAQGRFEAFHDVVFKKQDSLGTLTFTEYAVEAGVPDIAVFTKCTARPGPLQLIDNDSKMVKGIGGTGTPTVIINGLRYQGAPDSAKADSVVRDAIKVARRLP